MASSGVNVLRFSALGFGVAYGIWHQSTLTAKAKHNQIQREYQHQLSLTEKAKKEYAKKVSPEVEGDLVAWGRAGVSTLKRSSAEEWFGWEVAGVITDPDDSRFDLEAYLNMKAAE
ncbi:hypothetical protein MMC22_008563 [Lobaria immixta]|nr:hypothetical protein [Lobaria immixta]